MHPSNYSLDHLVESKNAAFLQVTEAPIFGHPVH